MAKNFFKFDSFSNGVSPDANKWKTHGMYSAGLDLVGIPETANIATGARPNSLQLSQYLEPIPLSSSTTIQGLATWLKFFARATGNVATTYGLDTTNNLIYKYDASNSWFVSAKTTSAATGGGGLQVFANTAGVNALFYGQNAVLGQLSADGVYNNNFQAFTNTTANPRPMKVFAGKLMIGNDNLIATYDGSTFTPAALTLTVGYIIRSLEVLSDYLIISMDNGVSSRIVFWNGGSAAPQEFYDLSESSAPILVVKEGKPYAIGRQIYELYETSYEVLFPTIIYEPGQNLVTPVLGSTALYKNQILFGLGQVGARGSNKNNMGGLWMLGKTPGTSVEGSQYPITESLHFMVPPWTTDLVDVGGIMYGDNASPYGLVVSYRNVSASNYGFAGTVNSGSKLNSASDAFWESLPMDFDTNAKKIFQHIKVSLLGTATSCSVEVYYRTDVDFTAGTLGSYILLGTLSGSAGLSSNQTLAIRKQGINIQFKFVFKSNAGGGNNLTNQLLDFTVVYDTLDLYR